MPSDEAPEDEPIISGAIGHIFARVENSKMSIQTEGLPLTGTSLLKQEGTPLDAIKTRHITGQVHAIINGNRPRITIAEGNSAFADGLGDSGIRVQRRWANDA